MDKLLDFIIRDLKNCATAQTWRNYLLTWLFSRKFQLLLIYRLGSACQTYSISRYISPILYWIMGTFYNCEIHFQAKIGHNVQFNHPIGVVIGQNVIIHDDVTIFQQVTIGSHGKPSLPWSYPTIHKGVKIFAKASIIGSITVGENAIIGAHALVLQDVPPFTTVAGVPAKIIAKSQPENEIQTLTAELYTSNQLELS